MKLWVNCFKDHFIKKDLHELDQIADEDLPDILKSFYKRKKIRQIGDGREIQEGAESDKN